jgi:hypothetical protein
VKRPHYGDEAKRRRALSRYIKNGEELLDQADGVRNRMEEVPETEDRAGMMRLAIDRDWGDPGPRSCPARFPITTNATLTAKRTSHKKNSQAV